MKSWKRALTVVLAAAVVCSTTVLAAADTQSISPVSKDESVYVILNPDGSVQKKTVSCWLHADNGVASVEDRSELADIQNVKSDLAPTADGEKLHWDTNENDVYYTGTTGKQLPVDTEITYTLNGREISAEELMGKSGDIAITIHLENREKQIKTVGGQEREVYTPFAVALVLDFPADTFQNVHCGEYKLISDDNNQLLSLVSLPGMKENFQGILPEELRDFEDQLQDTFTIQAKTEKFSMPTIMMAAATNFMELKEVHLNEKLTQLSQGMEELQEASAQLQDGTGALSEAMGQFDTKMGTFTGSYEEFDAGLLDAVKGAGELREGTKQLKEAIAVLKGKMTDELIPGIKGASSKQQELVQKMQELEKLLDGMQIPDVSVIQQQLGTAIQQVSNGSADAATQILTGKSLQQMLAGSPQEQQQAKAIMNAIGEIQKQAAGQISQLMAQLDFAKLQKLETSLKEIQALSGELMDSVNTLTSALYSPNDDPANPKTLAGAIFALAVGSEDADEGAQTLLDGLKTLKGASATIQQAANAFEEATGVIAEKTGELSDGMTQFKTDGIDALCDTDLIDRLDNAVELGDVLQQCAQEYRTFSGAPVDADTSVKFIAKVTAPDTKAESQEKPQEGMQESQSFWDKVSDFFSNLFGKN